MSLKMDVLKASDSQLSLIETRSPSFLAASLLFESSQVCVIALRWQFQSDFGKDQSPLLIAKYKTFNHLSVIYWVKIEYDSFLQN